MLLTGSGSVANTVKMGGAPVEALWLIWLALGRLVKTGALVFRITVTRTLAGIVAERPPLSTAFTVNLKKYHHWNYIKSHCIDEKFLLFFKSLMFFI